MFWGYNRQNNSSSYVLHPYRELRNGQKYKTKTKLDPVVIISDFSKPRISVRKCVKWVAEERNSIHFVNRNKEVVRVKVRTM